VYTPGFTGPLAVVVYFHGGGWVLYDLDTFNPVCRDLANAAGAIVVAVAYRLAPEHHHEFAEGMFLTRDQMRWHWNHYLPDPAERAHPCASPLRAPDLSGLPPAIVYTAENDPLRDDGEAYAPRSPRQACRRQPVGWRASSS
jgi:acetyl esterase/lipase